MGRPGRSTPTRPDRGARRDGARTTLTPLEHTAIDLALTDVVRSARVPILPMVVERILSPAAARADRRLAEDGGSSGTPSGGSSPATSPASSTGPVHGTFDPSLPMVSLDLSRVADNSTLVSVLMTCSSAWMEAALADPARRPTLGDLRRSVAADGAPGAAATDGRPMAARPPLRDREHAHLSQALRPRQRRRPGSAMRALASSLLANAETRIVYRQEPDQLGATGAALGLTRTEMNLLPALGTGQGLWRVKDRSFVVAAPDASPTNSPSSTPPPE